MAEREADFGDEEVSATPAVRRDVVVVKAAVVLDDGEQAVLHFVVWHYHVEGDPVYWEHERLMAAYFGEYLKWKVGEEDKKISQTNRHIIVAIG